MSYNPGYLNIQNLINRITSVLGPGQYIYNVRMTLTINIPPNAPAGQPIPVAMTVNLGQSSFNNQTSITIPATQLWFIADIYTTSSPTIDGVLYIYKNGVKLLETTANLSAISVTNPARFPLLIPLKYAPQETLTINFVPDQANGSTQVTQYAYAMLVVVDFTYIQQPPQVLASLIQRL